MTQANVELLDALIAAGCPEDKARAAAAAAVDGSRLATQQDLMALRADMIASLAAAETRIMRWVIGLALGQYALLMVLLARLGGSG